MSGLTWPVAAVVIGVLAAAVAASVLTKDATPLIAAVPGILGWLTKSPLEKGGPDV